MKTKTKTKPRPIDRPLRGQYKKAYLALQDFFSLTGPVQTCGDLPKRKLPIAKPAKDRTRLLVAAVTSDEAAWIHAYLAHAPDGHMPPPITAALTPLMRGLARQWLMTPA